jgi:anti-anti-sigma regulatory factor
MEKNMNWVIDKGVVVELALGSDPSTYQTGIGGAERNISASSSIGRSVIVDLTNVNWLDSHHLNWLLSLQIDVARRGGEVVLVQAQPNILKVLRMVLLGSKIYVKDTLQEAYSLLSRNHLLVIEDDPTLLSLFPRHFGSKMVVTTCSTLLEAMHAYDRYGNGFALIACDACLSSKVPNIRPFIETVRSGGYNGPMLAMSGSEEFNGLLVDWGCDQSYPKTKVLENIHKMFPWRSDNSQPGK